VKNSAKGILKRVRSSKVKKWNGTKGWDYCSGHLERKHKKVDLWLQEA